MTSLKLLGLKGARKSDFEKLFNMGITTSDNLLKRGRTPQGREEISDQTQVSETRIQKWINKLNLLQIEGIGVGFSDLLESSGVGSVQVLAMSNPEALLENIIQVNDLKKIVKRTPPLHEVKSWVNQAQIFPKAEKPADEKQANNVGLYGKRAKNNFEVEDNLKNYLHRVKQKHKNSNQKMRRPTSPKI